MCQASTFISHLRRRDDLACRTARPAQFPVKRRKRTVERLRHRNVPGVVAGKVVSQSPYAVCERGKGEQFEFEAKQGCVGQRSLDFGYLARSFQATEDIAGLDQDQLWCNQRPLGYCRFRPRPFWARIYEGRDQDARIDDLGQVLSASRAARMAEVGTLVL